MASAAGVLLEPKFFSGNTDEYTGATDDNTGATDAGFTDEYVHCTNPSDILKLLAHHWSAVFAKKRGNNFLSWGLLREYCKHVVWNWNLSQPPTLGPLMRLL